MKSKKTLSGFVRATLRHNKRSKLKKKKLLRKDFTKDYGRVCELVVSRRCYRVIDCFHHSRWKRKFQRDCQMKVNWTGIHHKPRIIFNTYFYLCWEKISQRITNGCVNLLSACSREIPRWRWIEQAFVINPELSFHL